MTAYPATQNTGSLISLIKAIGSNGVPAKFTTKDLPAWGFKSSHDRSIVSVLRFIDFLDGSGIPTDLWREARTKSQAAVGTGVRRGYADLFAMFPDAHRKDSESLVNFFKAKTDVGESGVKKIVATFKALAQIGDFENVDDMEYLEEEPKQLPKARKETGRLSASAPGMAVNLNIQLTLPSDASGEAYDKFFAAMKKHLLNE